MLRCHHVVRSQSSTLACDETITDESIIIQGPQGGPQVRRLLPALSQGILSDLPPPQQGHEPGLVPALQRPHAATEPPLQSDRRLAALADVAHGPGPAELSGMVPQGVHLAFLGFLDLGQLLSEALDLGLEFLLYRQKKQTRTAIL
ncbi:hypothetical protein INR49_014241 [Caranx melampygus]|nr:hypothetical protein INR49_014241 [Caranx melampygus]